MFCFHLNKFINLDLLKILINIFKKNYFNFILLYSLMLIHYPTRIKTLDLIKLFYI